MDPKILEPVVPSEKLLLPPKMFDPSDSGSLAPKIGVEFVGSVLEDVVVTGVVFKDDENIDLFELDPKIEVEFSLFGLDCPKTEDPPKTFPPEFVMFRVLLSTEDVLLLNMLADDSKSYSKYLKYTFIKILSTNLQKVPSLSRSPCSHNSS